MMFGLAVAAAAAANMTPLEVTIPGPAGPLAATLIDPARRTPVLIIIPGSGPTDRDGNNPLGVTGGVYRQFAEQLGAQGVATLRIDKRGMFGSKAAIPDANAVRIADYVADVRHWAQYLKARGKRCAWLAGHSEGGLIALAAAQDPRRICGLVLLAAPGRRLGVVLREQVKPLPPAQYAQVDAALTRLEQRQLVDPASVPAAVRSVFAPAVQGYMTDLVTADPAALAARIRLPMLIVQGDADLQVKLSDAQALSAANPRATLAIIPNLNHVWKTATAADPAANIATYGKADLAIDPAVARTVAAFVTKRR